MAAITVITKRRLTDLISFSDHVLAIGAGNAHAKVEMLSTAQNTWEKLDDYPYVKG